jgi:hypothetical protein
MINLSVNGASSAAMKEEDMADIKKAMASASEKTKAALAVEMAAVREQMSKNSGINSDEHATTLNAVNESIEMMKQSTGFMTEELERQAGETQAVILDSINKLSAEMQARYQPCSMTLFPEWSLNGH